LKRLSVRGCSSLTTLRVSSCLVGLDASGCTMLNKVIMHYDQEDHAAKKTTRKNVDTIKKLTQSKKEDHVLKREVKKVSLEALNLSGCRSLLSPPNSNGLFSNLRALALMKELDMTSVQNLPNTILPSALLHTKYLENISLRYIATDAMIHALCPNQKAMGSLKLVDAAFSFVTDEAVEGLVNRAKKLERCNLRGCKGISSSCYNNVPIYLLKRNNKPHSKGDNRGGEHDVAGDFIVSSDSYTPGNKKKRRKGDNIFFFAKS